MARPLTKTIAAVLVVHPATLAISKYFVGLSSFLELLLGFRIIRISIRVVLHRQSTIRTLNLVPGCVTGDAEDFVIAASR
jgi:hypothetical protein